MDDIFVWPFQGKVNRDRGLGREIGIQGCESNRGIEEEMEKSAYGDVKVIEKWRKEKEK